MTPLPADARNAAQRGQALAAEPGANAWVAANAGSGKTKVLIDRVARLLLQGEAPDSILCVTYTKAAASEMQDRLFDRLGAWCVMDESELRRQLAELEGAERTDVSQARELFARALETPGGLRIETIHAFCGRVLRRFPLEAGVAPGFHELDEVASEDLWDDAFRELGRIIASSDGPLTQAARLAAEAGGGANLSIIRALDARRAAIEAFISAAGGIDAAVERLRLALRAAQASAAEMLEAAMAADLPRAALARAMAGYASGNASDQKQAELIEIALSEGPAEDRFEAYCSIILTKTGELRKNAFSKGAGESHPIIASLFAVETPHGAETLRLLAAKEALAVRMIFEKSAALLRLAEVVLKDFDRRKAARAGLDFDDLILAVKRLLTRTHAADWVLWKLDGGVRHILLDEAQDTSPAQWSILRKLTEDIFSGLGVEREKPRTLFVVGDFKQSIYSFQGADPQHFLAQHREVRGLADRSGVPLNDPRLAMSFRSVGEVLTYVDEAFDPDHFGGEAPFSLDAPQKEDFDLHVPHRHHEAGSVELWPIEAAAKADDPDPWDAPLDIERESSPKVQLAQRIARFVRGEIDAGAAVWESGKQRAARPGDFLILVKRRTGGLFDAILQHLKLANLPVAGADRIQLLDSLAVQDCLNLVRFALCPEDDLVLAEILKGPFGGLNDDHLIALSETPVGSLWRRLEASREPDLKSAAAFLLDMLARRGEPPFEFLTRALEEAAIGGRAGWELILSRFGDPAREPVTALVDRAAGFDASGPPSLEMFLASVERHGGEVKRELSSPQDEVRVMTVHGAKGLQAPIVILPDTTSAPRLEKTGLFFLSAEGEADTEGCMPVWAGAKSGDAPQTAALRQISDARAVREHRRLLYVALTRAQDRLIVCGAWHGSAAGSGRDDQSWYGLCERAMGRLIAKGAAKESAEPGLAILGERPPRLTAARTDPTVPGLPAWLNRPAPVAERLHIATASSLGGAAPPALAPFGAGRAMRLRRGRLIHTLFEALPDIEARSRRKAGRDFLARQADLTKEQREEMLEAVLAVIEDERFAAVFARGGRPEAPVIGQVGDLTINGRVDRLVISNEAILVVDYKTDRPAPADVADVGEAYLRQMGAYWSILSQTWPDRPVRCLLVWTDGPRLMEVPASFLSRALERASG